MSSENNEEEEKYITLVNKILDDNGSLSKNETIAILNSIASIIEHEERVYLESITDPFEDTRRNFPIGKIIDYIKTDDFIELIIDKYCTDTSDQLCTAGLRILMALLSSMPSVYSERTAMNSDDYVEKLIKWIKTDEMKKPFATGVLGVIMEENEVTTQVVKSGIARLLLQRLRAFVKNKLQIPTWPKSGDSRNLTKAEMDYIEMRSILQCLAHMGDFQEVLGPVIQENGIEIINSLLKSSDKHVIVETLKFICSLLAHNKFAQYFVERGGLKLMLKLQYTPFVAGGVGLCLVGIAALTPIMETICRHMHYVEKLVDCGLQLLKSPVAEIKKNGCLFFHTAFSFIPLIYLFDKVQGLKTLLNVLRVPVSFPKDNVSGRHISHTSCMALRSYFRMHFVLAATHVQTKKNKKSKEIKHKELYKSITAENIAQYFKQTEFLTQIVSMLNRTRWKAASQFMENGGVELLLNLLNVSREWGTYNITHCALEVLNLVSLAPFTHSNICETKISSGKTGMAIILAAANGEIGYDSNVVLTALQILCNLVNLSDSFNQKKIWELVRINDGIRVLLDTLRDQGFVYRVNEIRELACQVLIGLSNYPTILQILKNSDISSVLSDQILNKPSTQENEFEFSKFKETALRLLSKTTGRKARTVSTEAKDHTLLRLQKAEVVANTPITYNQEELLQLIHEYLESKGLKNTANSLLNEAKIRPSPSQSSMILNKGLSSPLGSPMKSIQSSETRLDNIVTSFLKQQHRECEFPISVLPPFSLFKPHCCPVPKRITQSTNIASHIFSRQSQPLTYGGVKSRKHFRKYIYSRFRHIKSFKPEDPDSFISSTAFDRNGRTIFCGCDDGNLILFDIDSIKQTKYQLGNFIEGIQVSKDSSLLLIWSYHSSSLWKNGKFNKELRIFDNCNYAVFNNENDRIVGTTDKSTVIFDVKSGENIATLIDPLQVEPYGRNIACFHPNDDLILSDCILWDVRMPAQIIHRFDKLSKHGSCSLFHPSGNEVIINSEVWDLRTFQLLTSSKALGHSRAINFSPNNDVIYTLFESDYDDMKFRTVDSLNFDMIATMDIERTIVDLAVDPNDYYISLVVEENSEIQTCRLYEIGRKKRHDGDMDGMENKRETDSDESDLDSDDGTDDYMSDTDEDIDGDYLYDFVDDVLDGNVDIPNGDMFEAILTSGDDDDDAFIDIDYEEAEFDDDIDE